MVIVVDVNTGRSEDLKTPQSLFKSVSEEFCIPISNLALFNTDGREIHSEIGPLDSPLYLFPRDSIDFGFRVVRRNWESFLYFQGITTYEERFNFEDYETFPEHYQRIPEIEAELFDIVVCVKQAYAKFKTCKKYLTGLTHFLDVRVAASKIVLLNLQHYYRDVTQLYERELAAFAVLEEESRSALASPLLPDDSNGELRNILACCSSDSLRLSEDFQNLSLSDQLKVQEAKDHAKKSSQDLSKLTSKCIELQHKHLQPIQRQLEELHDAAQARENSLERLKAEIVEFNLREKQVKFLYSLEALTEYATYRRNLEIILNESGPTVALLAQSMLNEDRLNELQQIDFGELQSITDLILEFEQRLKAEERQILNFFENKAVRFSVESTQRLKYQVKHRVQKMKSKCNLLKINSEVVNSPKYNEVVQAANAEAERRRASYREICGLYSELSKHITTESHNRKVFMNHYGSILPKNAYPELTTTMLPTGHLRHLLKIEDEPLPEQRGTADSNTLVLHYQAELRKLEESYVKRMDFSRKENEKLEQDLIMIIQALETVKQENQGLKETVQSYSSELKDIRERTSEGKIKTFQDEIERLKMREESFKRQYIDWNAQLQEENSFIREKLSRSQRTTDPC